MSLRVSKRQLTSSDTSLLNEYLVSNPNAFVCAYELTPHHTSFSNNISVQMPQTSLVFKIPHSANNGREKIAADLITDPSNFTMDSFSTIYELPDFYVTADDSPNPNYVYDGLFTTSTDIKKAGEAGYTLFSGVLAPEARDAIGYVSRSLADDPFAGSAQNGYAQQFNIGLPQLQGAAAGPNNFPVVLQIQFRSPSYSSAFWPAGYTYVGFYINTNSRYYSNVPYNRPQLYNLYMTHAFRAMGYDNFVIGRHFSPSFTQVLESPVPAAPARQFCLNDGVLARYKSHIGDDNVAGVPMGYQQGTEHLFAGGYHADRWDTADFYFADFFKGGPLNEPIPHPALMGEILATNSRVNPDNFEEFYYKRHSALPNEYYTPNFVVTEEAMGMLGFSFYASRLKTITTLNKCFFDTPSSERISTVDGASLDKNRIRNYTDEKYIVDNYFTESGEDRHLMINRNYSVPHSVNDNSVDQALRYFGYIPFGGSEATHGGIGRFGSAIVVENAEKGATRGIEIYSGGPNVIPYMADYRIYISANASQVHTALGLTRLGDSLHNGTGLLYKYFMAEVITSVICVGDDPLDLEDPSSASLSKTARSIRKVLVLHRDFE